MATRSPARPRERAALNEFTDALRISASMWRCGNRRLYFGPAADGRAEVQSADRRPGEVRRWLAAYQAPRSRPKLKRRPWSSSRRSVYFWNLQRHSPGLEHLGIGSVGACIARIRLRLSELTASQRFAGIATVTAENLMDRGTVLKKGRP